MTGELRKVGDVFPFTYGKNLPSDRRNEKGAVPVYGSNGIVGYHDEPLTSGPTVVVGRKGTIGSIHLSHVPCWTIDTTYHLEFADVSSARFCAYALSTLRLDDMNSDSGVPGLNRDAAHDRLIRFPDRVERDKIAAVLGAFDDKIELNRQMASTLEEVARALFKSWFVDFDPVHAKAEGRDPGLPTDVAALFPDGFDDEGLPNGWGLGSPESLVEINPTTRIDRAKEAPYIDMAALPTKGHCIVSAASRLVGSGARFENGDTLLARITPCLENGKSAMVDCLDDDAVAWGSTEFIVMRPLEGIPKPLPYLIARDASFRAHMIAAMSGTSGRQRVPAEAIGRWTMAIPNSAVISAWGNAVVPMFDGIKARSSEAELLAKLRDALLPRLLSGELRVADTETVIAAA